MDYWVMKIPQPLRQVINISGVSDVLLMGPDDSFIFNGSWQRVANPFRSAEKLREQLLEMVIQSGERWDIAKPYVDFSIGNLRFHAMMGGVIAPADQVSIRIHKDLNDRPLDPKLKLIAESEDSFLVSGVTGSGKTTLLSKMLRATDARTVLVEQTPEIELDPPSVSLKSRRANIEGAGELSLSELLNQALRMRPDRIAIGEVRGGEIISLLLAINNGHRGAGATIHAPSPDAVLNRLVTLGLLSGVQRKTVLALAENLDWLIHLDRNHNAQIHRWAEL
jgi:pilus assembly protein CpaF